MCSESWAPVNDLLLVIEGKHPKGYILPRLQNGLGKKLNESLEHSRIPQCNISGHHWNRLVHRGLHGGPGLRCKSGRWFCTLSHRSRSDPPVPYVSDPEDSGKDLFKETTTLLAGEEKQSQGSLYPGGYPGVRPRFRMDGLRRRNLRTIPLSFKNH